MSIHFLKIIAHFEHFLLTYGNILHIISVKDGVIMTFGERLIELRKERGFTNRNDFAEYIGMPSTTLRNYETNVREPGHIFLKQMSDIFKVSIDYLLCMTDDRTIPSKKPEYTKSEIEHIKKYRCLDDHGKETVDIILEREYERTLCPAETKQVVAKNKDSSLELDHLMPIAAHLDNPSEEQMALVQKDLERLMKLKEQM